MLGAELGAWCLFMSPHLVFSSSNTFLSLSSLFRPLSAPVCCPPPRPLACALLTHSPTLLPRHPHQSSQIASLQVLELTDVALDDSFLDVLGEVLTSTRPASRSSGGAATATAPASGGGGAEEPFDFFSPDGSAAAITARNRKHQQQQQQRQRERESADAGRGGGGGGGTRVAGGGATVRLRTLVLGRCEGVSEAAFEAFLELAGGGGTVGPREGSRTRRSSGTSDSGGGGGGSRGRGEAGESGRGGEAAPAGFGLALSTVRLRGCRELGDRGLALLCAGAKGRLSDIQVRRG